MSLEPSSLEPVTGARRIAAYFLAGTLLVVGPAMAVWGTWFLLEASESASWPSTVGEVTRLDVRGRPDGEFWYGVSYRFEVDGVAYSSARNSLGDGVSFGSSYDSREAAEAAANERIPVGARLRVYYDPEAPGNALVKPGVQWSTAVPLILGTLFTPVGWLLVRGLRSQGARDGRERAGV